MWAEMKKMKWHEIEKECASKKVVIYGLGLGIRQFLEKYGNSITVETIIDNDVTKQGKRAGDLLPEAFQTKCGNIYIHSAEVLSKYEPKETIILVASSKRYAEIMQDLEKEKFSQIYVISLLEDFVQENKEAENVLQKQHEFAQKCLCTPIVPNKILFSSFANYADHEKYISEALIQLRPDFYIVWLVNDLDVELPAGVHKVLRSNWKKVLYEAETSKIWVTDTAVPDFFLKRSEQVYIQTKHWASITLKKFYLDAEATFQSEPEKMALWKRESEIIDYIIVGSEFDQESCKRGFGVDGKFIMAGSPRTDGMFREQQNRKSVYAYYGLGDGVRVLIYAPTYRFSKEAGKGIHQSREIEFGYRQIKAALEKRFGGDWMIALRLHPSVCDAVKDMELPDFVFDVSSYEDSEELVSAFDITVSDYSSIMFEPAVIKKPVFLYATDLNDYIVNEYELLIDYKELPFDIAENTKQLCENIISFDRCKYEKRLDDFLLKYGIREDGHASERVAEFISKLI